MTLRWLSDDTVEVDGVGDVCDQYGVRVGSETAVFCLSKSLGSWSASSTARSTSWSTTPPTCWSPAEPPLVELVAEVLRLKGRVPGWSAR